MTGYAELHVTSNYSFLRGASHIEELFAQASLLGLAALGITDRNSLAGIVRAHQRAGDTGVRLVVGCRLDLTDAPSVLVYPTDRPAYARLCRLLTIGKRRAGKGECSLGLGGPRRAWRGADRGAAGGCGGRRRPRRARPSAGRFFCPRLPCADRPPPPERRRPPATPGRPRHRRKHPHRRHRRRALPRARTPHPAGRADLHPATAARSTPPASAASAPPTATCTRRRKWPACSPAIRTPSPARWRSPTAAASRSTSCATNTRSEIRIPGQTPQQALETLTWDGAARRLSRRPARRRRPPAPPRTGADRRARLRALFPHRAQHRALRPIEGHPLPGPRLRRQLRGLLRARHHRDRPHPQRPAVRTFHQRRAPRAARHRRRFRARAARGSHPVDLQHLRPRPRRAVRHRDPLPRARRGARGRQGARPARGRHRRAGRRRSGAGARKAWPSSRPPS